MIRAIFGLPQNGNKRVQLYAGISTVPESKKKKTMLASIKPCSTVSEATDSSCRGTDDFDGN